MDIDKILKVLFILSCVSFLIIYVSVPKTHCEACKIDYEQTVIDGEEAFQIWEDACISYDKPYGYHPFGNFSNITISG